MNTLNLNAANETLIKQYAAIQTRADQSQACSTQAEEVEHLNARGQERFWLPQMATQLTGHYIAKLDDVTEEREIQVYAQGVGRKTQSLNASLKMVALHSVLLSGFTDPKTIETALDNWLIEDSINEQLDTHELSLDLISAMVSAEILTGELGKATTNDGAFYDAYGVTEFTNDLRINTLQRLWENAQPRMQPLRFPIMWVSDGKGNAVCEIPNLKLMNGKSKVSQDFIDAANKASNVGYVINTAIRTELELWLERAEMPEMPDDEREALKVMNKHDDRVRIVEELLLLPINETMYFPHTSDWRGRFYARGGLTQFQSIKECKAIFDFARVARPKDPSGLYLHVANAHGMDKVSIESRIMWVRYNMADIIAGKLATNIYAKRSALALGEYAQTGETQVVCHIDGTCNGTQWTSALFRDEKTARLVNVCASSLDQTPYDLYGVIAERAVKLSTGLEREAIQEFMRDLTKAPIMVLGYGAGEDTLLETVAEFLAEKGHKANPKKVLKAIMTAIKLSAPALTKLTDNLKRILKASPKHLLSWHAFDLTVRAENYNTDHLNLHGTSYTAKQVGKRVPDEDALARGISPNYVHSMDSAHLRAVIRNSPTGLSCIHDSVGAPADCVLEVNKVIRETFHEINQVDLLENIYDALGANYTQQWGTLDIDEVLEATYIFS